MTNDEKLLRKIRALGWIGTLEQYREWRKFQDNMPPEQRRKSDELLASIRARIAKYTRILERVKGTEMPHRKMAHATPKIRRREKYIEMAEPNFYQFGEQTPDIKAAWNGAECAFCRMPATGLMVGSCTELGENMFDLHTRNPDWQPFIDGISEQEPSANVWIPVCQLHADEGGLEQ